MQKIYVDTNVFILSMEGYGEKKISAHNALLRTGVNYFSSTFTLGEILVKPIQINDNNLYQAYWNLFEEENDSITVVNVTREILAEAANIRAKTSKKLPDCIHLATAIIGGCDQLITDDHDFPRDPRIAVVTLDDLKPSNT